MDNQNPIVSVCVQTYNHENYITECLQSILAQETSFPFEIIVGEDDSPDGTRAICKKIAEENPDKIRLILNSRENVIYINERATGRWNFLNNLSLAKGKYIAICEGDDYWTDPKKLQKQVDFLNKNPDFVTCFHKVDIFNQSKGKISGNKPNHDKQEFALEDILLKNLMPTCSMLFRKENLTIPFPDMFYKTAMGDFPLNVMLSQNGKMYFMKETMAVYRVHSGSSWHGTKEINNKNNAIEALKLVDQYLDHKYSDLIKARMADYELLKTGIYLRENDKANARKTFQAIDQNILRKTKYNKRWSLINRLCIYVPLFNTIFQKIR